MFWGLFICVVLIKPWETKCITNRRAVEATRNFRRHVNDANHYDQAVLTDWEIGLREAAHQALLREHYTDRNLQHHLQTAPLYGKQHADTLFGDIAVLARGQLYGTVDGYIFVQDPYQNDCDDCHTYKKVHYKNDYRPHGNELLIALWTVKRIRHRNYDQTEDQTHRFELEFTISPISAAISAGFVTKNGRFDYNIPGHIFVIKSDRPITPSGNNINQNHYNINGPNHFRPGIVLNTNGFKQVLHSYPGFYTSHPEYHKSTTDPKEIELYKKLIASLAQKTSTSTTQKQTTGTTSNAPQKFTLNIGESTPKQPQTTLVPVQATTLVELSTGHVVPLTEVTSKHPTTQNQITTGFVPIIFPTTKPAILMFPTQPTDFLTEDLFPTDKIPPTQQPSTKPPTITTIHYYTPSENTIATSTKQTKPYSTTQKYTPTKTKIEDQDEFDLFPEAAPTKPMKANKPAINEQLPPPPEKNYDSTIPYISTTTQHETTHYATQPTEKPVASSTNRITTEATTITTSMKTEPPTEAESTISSTTNSEIIIDSTVAKVPSTATSETETTGTFYTGTTYLTKEPSTSGTVYTGSTYLTKVPTTGSTYPAETTYFTKVPATTIAETTGTIYTPEATYPTVTKTNTVEDYITNEPTRTTSKETTTVNQSSETITTVQTTNSSPETTPENSSPETTPQYILTNIHADGSVTETTTPIKSTKPTYIVTTDKLSPGTLNDFLADTENAGSYVEVNKSEVNDDDIFGLTKATTKTTTTKKFITQSDLEYALFGKSGNTNNRQEKSLRYETPQPKVIYSNFYEASTLPATTPMTPTTDYETTSLNYGTTPNQYPPTSQSYSTSISFIVNTKPKPTYYEAERNTIDYEPTVIAKVSEIPHDNKDYKIYKAELPTEESETTPYQEITTTLADGTTTDGNVPDAFALQLVNHARSIDYLSQKSTSSKPAKYKRRNYVSKAKSQRKLRLH